METFTTTAPTVGSAFSGHVMGGRNAIIGATVKIYATNGGYGIGNLLQEANQVGTSAGQDTDATGSFNFAGGFSCPAGQFAYITSAGGNTGANAPNPKALLVAALGRCEDLYSGTTYTGNFILMDEVTTVATAYALGNFATVTGTGATAAVGIGAPSTNNATTGTSTAAAGLRHAFQNALNLASPSNGTANANLPNNALAKVPQQLINSIANSLVACVNSNGTAAACTTIFNATSVGGVAPTDTFSAIVNLARNPTLNSTITGTTAVTPAAFFSASTAQTSVYGPVLTAAPRDYSMAINFPRGMGAGTGIQGLQFPISLSLDADDVLYVANQSANASANSNLASFDSDGTLLSFTPDNPLVPLAPDVTPDALGNVYQLTSANPVAALRFTSTAGTLGITGTNITVATGTGRSTSGAVDAHNNLWFGTVNGTTGTRFEVTSAGITGTSKGITTHPTAGVAVDPYQNIWFVESVAAGTSNLSIVQNTGTIPSPINNSVLDTGSAPGSRATGISFVSNSAGGAGSPFVAYVTSRLAGTTAGITPVTPTINTVPTVGSVTVGSLIHGAPTTYAASFYSASDGAGTIWVADNTRLMYTIPGSSLSLALAPCVPTATGNAACGAAPITAPRRVAIDAAGSVWVANSTGGNLVQVIGTATPAWPLLSGGKVGKP